jgi:hypothetical protein
MQYTTLALFQPTPTPAGIGDLLAGGVRERVLKVSPTPTPAGISDALLLGQGARLRLFHPTPTPTRLGAP